MKNIQASSFIKNALKSFIITFSKTRVRYEFDIDADVHCIEVAPSHVYHLEDEYIKWEKAFTNKFIESYPDQNICFFSDDSIMGINNIHFELLGTRFGELNSTNDNKSYLDINQIYIINSPSIINIENISSSTKVFNQGITYKVKHTNLIIESANSLTSITDPNKVLFANNFPMVA